MNVDIAQKEHEASTKQFFFLNFLFFLFFYMSHRSMAKDNSNSQGLILRVYPTINIQPLKHDLAIYLGVSLGLSLLAMGDGLLR